MGKIAIQILIAVLIVPCSIGLLYLCFVGVAVLQKGYTWSEMDWNSDGHTSIKEFFGSSDIGKREYKKDGRDCVAYYAYKDGIDVKDDCK